MTKSKTLTISYIKEVVSTLAGEYGAERVYLFGSYARGDETFESDVDLRIDKGAICGWEIAGLLADLEETLGLSVDLVTTKSLDNTFLKAISMEEVLLYEVVN